MSEPQSGLDALMQQRQRKLDALSEAGMLSYANNFRPDISIAQFMQKYADLPQKQAAPADVDATPAAPAVPQPQQRLAGRIMAVNSFGKAAFVRIQDDSSDKLAAMAAGAPVHGEPQQGESQKGLLQLYVRRDNLDEAAQLTFKNLDIGDWIGVVGSAMRTKTGELTVLAQDVSLLCKSLRPLPEKWHGLADIETRYRQRYLDLIVNPEVRTLFRQRSQVVDWLRRTLIDQDFLEVETPMMHPMPGGATAKPFVTHHNALDMDLYLRIAPELYLKRLVVGGFSRVFEINRNFRNEGIDTSHNPEFTMLEFYQAYASCEDMMARAEELLGGVAKAVLGTTQVALGDTMVELAGPYKRMTMREAIAANGGPSPASIANQKGLDEALKALGGHAPVANYGQGIALLFEHYAERNLIQPTIIYEFPRDISPLARSQDGNPDWVERFELFVGGRELANAFSELNDPAEQRRRFAAQTQERDDGNDEAHGTDEDYLVALEHGLPPTGGFGMGIDRLLMLLTGSGSIRDVVLFPQMRPERSV